ncbi:hypothetical protein PVK06_029749 [Gossypium arboreum]|uniref:Uncharacterized protein n=1 Tax=Gossypium arboreum TaxID=29729 RepID=A0ABR0NMK0_GOSAR|nr:hypothetical protein PVK06_029749 [Gossypium arboreum]
MLLSTTGEREVNSGVKEPCTELGESSDACAKNGESCESSRTSDTNSSLGSEEVLRADFEDEEGLMDEIFELFPRVEHRVYARHLYSNWMKENIGDLQQAFWGACKSYITVDFEDNINKIDRIKHSAKWPCSCRRWDLTSIPCSPAVATILWKKSYTSDFVYKGFKKYV